MTLWIWICIGVYVVGMAVTPGVMSFVYGKLWAKRDQSVEGDFCGFIVMFLWPVFTVMWIIHAWSCWMSGVGMGLNRWFKELLTDSGRGRREREF